MRDNFDHMAHLSSQTNSVVIRGTHIGHFENEVFSWHHINGMNAEGVLPAILVTNNHPANFRDYGQEDQQSDTLIKEHNDQNMKMILIPLKKFCKTSTDVVSLIQKIFDDIRDQKDISDFSIARKIYADSRRKIFDAIILQPNIGGIGLDIKKLTDGFFNDRHET